MQDIEQLTVSQIMTAIGWTDRSSLARYLDNEQTRMLLSASGASRPTYPRAVLPTLAALYQAHQEHRCTPKTAPMLISTLLGTTSTVLLPDNRNSDLIEQREVILPDNRFSPKESVAPAEMVQVMREFVQTVKDITPVPDDCLLTRSQVAALLACAPGTVSRLVRPLRRGAYRRSDCLRYIQSGLPLVNASSPPSSMMNAIAPPSSVTAQPHGVAARVAVSRAEFDAEDLAESDKQQKKGLTEIDNWLKAKMITKAEADLLRIVEQPGKIDAKNFDKLMKIRKRVIAAEALAKNPNAAEEARERDKNFREGVAGVMRENARIARGLE